MKRFAPLFVMLLFAALLTHGATTLAQGALDQSNTGSNPIPAFIPPAAVAFAPYGQTFTAGITGTMDAVSVAVAAPPGATGETIDVSVYATNSSGLPTGAALATATVAIPVVPAPPPVPFTTVSLTPGVPVVTGTLYALVFSNFQPAGGVAALALSGSDSYPRGSALISPTGAVTDFVAIPVDFYFQTFVSPPAPSVTIIGQALPQLTLATKGCGTTTPSGTLSANVGQNVVVRAVPCSGSTFTGWTGGPCDHTAINPCDIGVGANMLVTANFTP